MNKNYLKKINKTVKAVIEKSNKCESSGELYLDAADVSKILKMRLRYLYPDTKFSVTSDKYSTGSSINVDWQDGPVTGEINDLVRGYQLERFDGMIDMATLCKGWLCADGSMQIAQINGTTDSKGYIEDYIADPPSPGAVLCYGGADYINTSRNLSYTTLKWAVDKAYTYYGELTDIKKPIVEEKENWKGKTYGQLRDVQTVQIGNRWLEQMLYGYAECFDYTKDPYKKVSEVNGW